MKLIFGEKKFARKRGNQNLLGSEVVITGWECRQLEGNQHAQQTSQNSCLKVCDGSAPWRCQFFEDPSGVHTSLSWWIWGHSWPLASIRELMEMWCVMASLTVYWSRTSQSLLSHLWGLCSADYSYMVVSSGCFQVAVAAHCVCEELKKKLLNHNENWE